MWTFALAGQLSDRRNSSEARNNAELMSEELDNPLYTKGPPRIVPVRLDARNAWREYTQQ